jgi:hypothetical protein
MGVREVFDAHLAARGYRADASQLAAYAAESRTSVVRFRMPGDTEFTWNDDAQLDGPNESIFVNMADETTEFTIVTSCDIEQILWIKRMLNKVLHSCWCRCC